MKGITLVALLALTGVTSVAHAQLSGAFVHAGYGATDEAVTDTQWPLLLDELKDLGNDTIIITPTRVLKAGQGCADSVTDFEWVKGFPSRLGTILEAAKVRGMKVIVGTTLTSGTSRCPSFWVSGNTSAVEADIGQAFATLAGSYGAHPAFSGWYIPDEPGPVPLDTYDYYARVTAALKALLPTKPVMVAPYMSAQPPTPATLASAAVAFRNATKVDVQIWQDGIGANAGAKLFHWSRAGYSTEQYYQALAGQLGAGGLWADVEIFNYGDPLFQSGAYRSASAQRINQQLWSARPAGKTVSWLHQWHMSEVIGPNRGYVEAPRLMGVYRGFYGLGTTLLFPLNYAGYSWTPAPSASYPDSTGYELFDRRTGDPRNPLDPAWVGTNGAARVTIDLGVAKPVDWIGVHTLTYPGWGIRTPVTLDIYCGSTLSTLVKVATAAAPFTQASLASSSEAEYVLGNRTPLGASCRYLDLRMPNSYWTFLSEIEVTSESATTPVNRSPTVSYPLSDQYLQGGEWLSYTFPTNVFTDPDQDTLAYVAKRSDGTALPAWLSFNSATRTFSGTAPNVDTLVTVRVTASDGRSGSAQDDFGITIERAGTCMTCQEP